MSYELPATQPVKGRPLVLAKIDTKYRSIKKKVVRRWLLAKMPKQAVCAEIGVYEGKFSRRIVEFTQPKKLHLIDPWHFQTSEAYKDSFYGGEQGGGQAGMDRRHDMVKSMFASQIADGSIAIHRNDSSKAAAEFPDRYFDWVYIDGNHLYEFVRDDLRLFRPKVRPGGYICGDDYHADDNWFHGGVKRAVDEFVAAGEAKPVFFHDTQFILRV
jgi:hypothetical protein